MGSCLSKKNAGCASSSSTNPVQIPEKIDKIKVNEETHIKKEIFIIKHRKSHEISSPQNSTENVLNVKPKSPSCTNEEVDAILIQCGRLSRTSSGGRKYSGSKRSYDFDNNDNIPNGLDQDIVDEKISRRRTPSRERSNSKSPGKRRVSRSPGRRVRSESPVNSNSNAKPGKMISVPPSVNSSLADQKVHVKRIQVKRNVGNGGDVATNGVSPKARLSRNNSRKGDNSPFRRNPLTEIDTNIISQAPNQKRNPENKTVVATEKKPNSTKVDSNLTNSNCKTKEQEKNKTAVNDISSGHTLTRSRSSRLSRDLDTNANSSSYTALLLEDIQNFHQKNTIAPPPSFSLPPCVTKACSILEAVADLNSSTGSNLPEERRRNIINSHLNKSNEDTILPAYVKSEVVVGQEDDLMKPSFHKYVTVRRGMIESAELEEQESSGSNSFVSSQKILGLSSSWEPNSAESTDRWTCNSSSSKPVSRNNESRISRGRNRTGSKGPVNAST